VEAQAALEAEAQASSMTLLQRGVDLLNVSPVPQIAETTLISASLRCTSA
jgi:hypothetical protein